MPEPLAEPNVFDLTWRNYLLPSQLFPNCCGISRRQPIRLEEDDDELFLGPDYYRDYLDTRDWEADPYNDYSTDTHRQQHPPPPPFLLPPHQQQAFADIVTRNPFGKSHVSKKKKKNKKNKPVRDVDLLGDHEEDAEFLGDEQIAHLAYNRYSKGDMDQYGEEAYLDGHGGPIVQEMQTPPQHKEYYAARSMPSAYLVQDDFNDDQQQQQQKNNEASSSSSNDQGVVVKAAQNLLSDRLEDLTDKLVYIKNNIMDINNLSPEEMKRLEQDDDDQVDKTTLRTLDKTSTSPVVSSSSDKDMDSVASEALDEYESHHIHRNEEERRRSGASQFNFPFAAGGNDSPPFGSDHHPFSYFTNNHRASYHDEDDDDNTPGLSIRGVLNFGKNWLGGGDSP